MSGERRREALAGYLFILPNFLGFLVFVLGPVVAALALGFVEWDLGPNLAFVGLSNYRELIMDGMFWKYVFNTLFLMLGIPLGMAGSLVLALVLNQKIRGRVAFRTVYFLPTMCAGVAIFFLWKWILDADFGLANQILVSLGLNKIGWLTTVEWAKPSLILMGLWGGIGGFNMILYLAALQNVPRHLYEAADIDGAGRWRKFWNVTWPYLTPTTFFITIMSIIGGLQGGFEAAYIMTKGGPARSTTTISYYLFQNIYNNERFGYAAAIAWALFLMVFVFTLINWRLGGKLVSYD
ncbi:MAG: sugar ABC transporter permease [Thermoleophilia bacterium]|nr:sugar ABC transporter permease [Thermoleophilia bacterium]